MTATWSKPKLIESASRDVVPNDPDSPIALKETLDDGTVVGWHAHTFAQTLIPEQGAITVFMCGRCFVVPMAYAAHIPAGCLHTVTTLAGAELTTVCSRSHMPPSQIPAAPSDEGDPEAVRGTVALIRGAADCGAIPKAERAMVDGVRIPEDRRARPIAFRLANRLDDNRTLEAWGDELGASERTLNRIFKAEVDMGFREWRMQLLVLQTTALMLAGCSVKQAAGASGYAGASAFVAAFRAATGMTPLRYASQATERARATNQATTP
ncbi:AraC family transcriptional regulator [Pararobbsia silviterrae]|uniref:AraC family transcriptional regulator n=1 Tax=Pararobbsia silviterrae TaxID=1792498 RepID=A0A494YCS2_9BURK|nr:AraC family transcriptional regulator [Pararobbsia silviterrae]RKP57804.1 AraC family transcriptional regulator [Pararobbsia silviterrae]